MSICYREGIASDSYTMSVEGNNSAKSQAIYVHPDLRQRSYNEVEAKVSVPTMHLLWVILQLERQSVYGFIRREELESALKGILHEWIIGELDTHLERLRKAKCIHLEE